jgi:hypothetical protein
MWKLLGAAIIGLAAALSPAVAATFRIDLFVGPPDNPYGDGLPDWFGTFDVAAPSDLMTPVLNPSILVAGIDYDRQFTFGPYFQMLGGNVAEATIDGIIESGPIPLSPLTVASIGFSTFANKLTRQYWYLTACSLDTGGLVACSEIPNDMGGQSGGYRLAEIAPIPLPATALLLPVGLGALLALRRRR